MSSSKALMSSGLGKLISSTMRGRENSEPTEELAVDDLLQEVERYGSTANEKLNATVLRTTIIARSMNHYLMESPATLPKIEEKTDKTVANTRMEWSLADTYVRAHAEYSADVADFSSINMEFEILKIRLKKHKTEDLPVELSQSILTGIQKQIRRALTKLSDRHVLHMVHICQWKCEALPMLQQLGVTTASSQADLDTAKRELEFFTNMVVANNYQDDH